MMLYSVLSSMRVNQWYKNFVLFIGILFSRNLGNLWMWTQVLSALAIFCLLSSCTYIINDISDLEKDKKHPLKRNRPIASGKISVGNAIVLALAIGALSLISAFVLNVTFGFVSLVYVFQNVIYTFWLKHVVLVDVITISVGFVWRAIAGCVVIGVLTSPWLIICSFLLALFLALEKRRLEITVIERAEERRSTLELYSKSLVDKLLNVTTACLLLAYSIYTFESGYFLMMATIPLVFLGVFRYIQLFEKKASEKSVANSDPIFFLKDRIIQVDLILWILISLVALYDLQELFGISIVSRLINRHERW